MTVSTLHWVLKTGEVIPCGHYDDVESTAENMLYIASEGPHVTGLPVLSDSERGEAIHTYRAIGSHHRRSGSDVVIAKRFFEGSSWDVDDVDATIELAKTMGMER